MPQSETALNTELSSLPRWIRVVLTYLLDSSARKCKNFAFAFHSPYVANKRCIRINV